MNKRYCETYYTQLFGEQYLFLFSSFSNFATTHILKRRPRKSILTLLAFNVETFIAYIFQLNKRDVVYLDGCTFKKVHGKNYIGKMNRPGSEGLISTLLAKNFGRF